MRPQVLVSLLVISALVGSFVPQCQAQNWEEALVSTVMEQVTGLWRQGEMELMGHYCNYTVVPKIRSWELYYYGTMWCPGWTPIRGSARTRSRSGVVGDTTRDFVRKAFRSGLITEDQARDWLNS